MELPCRDDGDRLLRPGEMVSIRDRLRNIAPRHDLTAVVISAFDHRTKILPFSWSVTHIAPAGARAIGAALTDVGIQTRVVLQQWNPHVQPSQLMLQGRRPDLLLISAMQIHGVAMQALLADVARVERSRRPLVLVGGPAIIYEPWRAFGDGRSDSGVDLAVTGEEYVLLSLLEVLLAHRGNREPIRQALDRARQAGTLDDIPGLVFPAEPRDLAGGGLVDTGVQRLLADLDELPHPIAGYGLLEPPSRRRTLADRPLPLDRVGRHSPIASVILTSGCRLSCPYCPIPAYNQRTLRAKSGPRIADEMKRIHEQCGIRYFFGTDDNFLADHDRALEICRCLEQTVVSGRPLRHRIRWSTEATVHDILATKDHLRLMRKAGATCFWSGVEDMTATFIRKGQGGDRTLEAIRSLRRVGIDFVPMLMHHDEQPLYTRRGSYGLLNQMHRLRKAGSVDIQVLILTPAPGSRSFEQTFQSGMVIASAGSRPVTPNMIDGNYVIATHDSRPWRLQLRLMAALAFMYNPLRLLGSIVRPHSARYLWDCLIQCLGCWGLLRTLPRMAAWAIRLRLGRVRKRTSAPTSPLPMRGLNGACAAHDPAGWAAAPMATTPQS